MPQRMEDELTEPTPSWRNCALLTAIFAVVYGALLSTQWVAGTPDSEYYLAIARNLTAGMGFVWDGRPVLMVPPAWPLFLAGAMKISHSMLFLNLTPYVCSLAGIALWYFVLEKITTPRRAFAVMLIFGILFNYHRFAQHFYSESLFVPLLAGTLLLALRIRQGPVRPWHVVLMFVLCCTLVLVRWAGIFFWPLIAAACFSWRPWHEQKGAILAAGLAAIALIGTFLGTRKGMEVYARNWLSAQEAIAIRTASDAGTTDEAEPEVKTADEAPDLQWHSKRTRTAVTRAGNWTKRVTESGHWLAGLYWPPAQAAQSLPGPGLAVNIVGWIMWIPVLVGTIPRIRRGEWIWIGMFGLCAGMMFFAGLRGRYLTPAAPLLLLATLNGIDALTDARRRPLWRRTGFAMRYAGVGSIVLCNIAIWATSAWILHTSRFQQTWCGGDYAAIVSIADFLASRGADDGQIAVSRCMDNFGRCAASEGAGRLVHLLTGRIVRYSPVPLSQQPPDVRLSRWAEKHGVRYYVYRPPILPWRLSHLRLPWLQAKITGRPVTTWNPSFVLYELVGDQLLEVRVPQTQRHITTVPGLSQTQAAPPAAGDAGDANPV